MPIVAIGLSHRSAPVDVREKFAFKETEIPEVGDVPFYQKPLFWAGIVVVVFFILNIIFW